ncbi:MAG TPA: MFS transporter [Acidimicrobiia bacterium]|nr:MFS transporter [Acidimicrobiia bacterium]
MTGALTVEQVRRRYLALVALRWLPTGLLIPVFMLLPLERGLSLSEIGLAAAAQGLVVLLLELPTGGLADSLGRKRVLIASSLVGMSSVSIYLLADTFGAFFAAFTLQGVFRALDSGPLEAWFVDATHAADPDASIHRGLSGAGVVLGIAIAAGALLSGLLVAWEPLAGVEPLAFPVMVSLGLQVTSLIGLLLLMSDVRQERGWNAAVNAARETPAAIGGGLRLLRDNRVLLALVAVELFWGFGMATFESFTPLRLAEVLSDTDRAAVITGPAASAAWLVSAAGAATVPWLGRRIGLAPAAGMLRILQGLAVVGIGMATGVPGVIAAYLFAYLFHGASNPAHLTLLHRQVDGSLRATVSSLNSMAGLSAGALGLVVLTALADATSLSAAMYVGAVILAAAAPLYVPAWKQSPQREPATARA